MGGAGGGKGNKPATIALLFMRPRWCLPDSLQTMKKSSARSTIADVARHAGVSKATVSRFLNHRETLLSPQIAARVEAAVTVLGYVPSPMAQALKRGRSRLVGLVVA